MFVLPQTWRPMSAADFETNDYRDRDFDASDNLVRTFRSRAIANTYAETGPFADPDGVTAFQIGADRILTRTAPAFPQ